MNANAILIDAKAAAALFGVSLRTFRNLIKARGFPKPRMLGPRSYRWVRAELEAYACNLPATTPEEPPVLTAARAARAQGIPPAPAPFGGQF